MESIINDSPDELIVVDGGSKDQSVEVSRRFTDKVIFDLGEGLGSARNLGLDHATGDYIFFVGPDNVLPEGTIKKCLDELDTQGYCGVSPCTRIREKGSYLAAATDAFNRLRFFPGRRDIIGTPHFYDSKVLNTYRFDSDMRWSDDTDLCHRLKRDGFYVGMVDTYVYDISPNRLGAVWRRWINYGLSDYQFFQKYKSEWTSRRRLRSLFHPIFVCLIAPINSKRITCLEKLTIVPFLMFILFGRYVGWVKQYF